MSESTTPAATDEILVEPEAPETEQIDDEVPEEPETIEERAERVGSEARASFSLRERLSGFKHRRGKVVLFLDLEAMQEIAKATATADDLFRSAERKGITDERRTELLDQHNKALDEKERLTEKLQASIAVAHLTTIPGPATEQAVRRARKRISAIREVMTKRASDETLPEEQRHEAREWLEDENSHFEIEIGMQTMAKGIEKVVFHDGQVDHLTIEDVRDLHDTLPANQWQELYGRFESLLFDEHVAREAVDEPGFSQGS